MCHAVASPTKPTKSNPHLVRLMPLLPPHLLYDANCICCAPTDYLSHVVSLCPELVNPGIAAEFCVKASVLNDLIRCLVGQLQSRSSVSLGDAVPFLVHSALAKIQVLKADYCDIPGKTWCPPDPHGTATPSLFMSNGHCTCCSWHSSAPQQWYKLLSIALDASAVSAVNTAFSMSTL